MSQTTSFTTLPVEIKLPLSLLYSFGVNWSTVLTSSFHHCRHGVLCYWCVLHHLFEFCSNTNQKCKDELGVQREGRGKKYCAWRELTVEIDFSIAVLCLYLFCCGDVDESNQRTESLRTPKDKARLTNTTRDRSPHGKRNQQQFRTRATRRV